MARIRAPLEEILVRHVIFIFDSCFSGTIFTARSPDDPPVELTTDNVARLMETPARNFITAGRANERIPAHSPIPDLFLAALNGAADRYQHGVVSAAEIGIYLQDQMLRRPRINITPQEGRLENTAFAQGEFLFRVPTPPPSALPKNPDEIGRDDIAYIDISRVTTNLIPYVPALNAQNDDQKRKLEALIRAIIDGPIRQDNMGRFGLIFYIHENVRNDVVLFDYTLYGDEAEKLPQLYVDLTNEAKAVALRNLPEIARAIDSYLKQVRR
jgi:hypothetical protein